MWFYFLDDVNSKHLKSLIETEESNLSFSSGLSVAEQITRVQQNSYLIKSCKPREDKQQKAPETKTHIQHFTIVTGNK